jgi:non-ribosomal peptide synthetase-like protein
LGSPGFFLPQRQTSTAFSAETTFNPSRRLWLARAAIEFFRVTLPSTCFLVLTSVLFSIIVLLHEHTTLVELLLLFPLLFATCGLTATLFVVLMKWVLLGRYRSSEQPLWSTFVWRNELLTALHENLADLFLTTSLEGTPLLPWFFRLLGAKIGRRVFMKTTALTEFDLITIGDDVALNHDATVQTHLFEDRVMKMSHIEIGPRCSVGAMSLVLYDTKMEAGATLGDLSLLMKGETLPAESHWQGIPARVI